jgi:hypothetical protein
MLGGLEQTRDILRKRTSRRLSSSLDQDHEGCIPEVPQEEGHSSIYKLISAYFTRTMEIAMNSCNMFLVRIMIILYPRIELQC